MLSIQSVKQPRLFHAAFVALAILLAQWAGMVHRHEHASTLEAAVHNSQTGQILHDCLAFDALTTAHTPVAQPGPGFAAPQLALIGKITDSPSRSTAQTPAGPTRVRDPPTLI